jgi:hypothetical protein
MNNVRNRYVICISRGWEGLHDAVALLLDEESICTVVCMFCVLVLALVCACRLAICTQCSDWRTHVDAVKLGLLSSVFECIYLTSPR